MSLFRPLLAVGKSRLSFSSLASKRPSSTLIQQRWTSSLGPNPGLESVISQGQAALEQSAMYVQNQTRHASLSKPSKSAKKQTQTPRQLAEAQRILDAATEALDDLAANEQNIRSPWTIAGEPIVLLHVQVNANAKQAKVYWTLPYTYLMDPRMTMEKYQKMVKILQPQLNPGDLARRVYHRLRNYYAPRIHLVPATQEMVSQAMTDYWQD
eukprot:Nitzschia sp. Nitz4//scaffold28_size193895//49523//50155//NITZ4_001639-RA/size193895-processed-gene-0.54-mRNA-1//-1//CDS//3329545904//330//frame0